MNPRVWWADRLAPTLIVEPVVLGSGESRVVLGDADAPFLLTVQEAHEIGTALLSAAGEARRIDGSVARAREKRGIVPRTPGEREAFDDGLATGLSATTSREEQSDG